MQDRYYIDYRRGEIIKNLDTSFLAPEVYNEVEINDDLSGTYVYTYIDEEGKMLDFSFTEESLKDKVFWEMLSSHCDKNDFTIASITRKLMYVTQEEFNRGYVED